MDIYTIGKDGKRKMAGLLERVESLDEATHLSPLKERREAGHNSKNSLNKNNSDKDTSDTLPLNRRREDPSLDPVTDFLKGVFNAEEKSSTPHPISPPPYVLSPALINNRENSIHSIPSPHSQKSSVQTEPKMATTTNNNLTQTKKSHPGTLQPKLQKKTPVIQKPNSRPNPPRASSRPSIKEKQYPSKSQIPVQDLTQKSQTEREKTKEPSTSENSSKKIISSHKPVKARGWVVTNPAPKKGRIIRLVAIILFCLLILEATGVSIFSYNEAKSEIIAQNNRIVDETSGQLEWRVETIINAAYILFAEETPDNGQIFDKSNYIIYMGVNNKNNRYYNKPLLEKTNLTSEFIDDVILNLKWTERKISEDNMFLFNVSGRIGFPVMGIVTPLKRNGETAPLIILIDLRKILTQETKEINESLYPRSTFILNSDGDVLIHPIESYITNFTNYSDKHFFKKTLSSQDRIQLEYTDNNGEFFLASTYKIPLTGGIVVAQQPKKNLYTRVWNKIRINIIFSTATLLLAILILIFIPRRFYENKGRWITWEEKP